MTETRAGCYVISLRPAGEHGAVRRAAAARGWRTIALSPWKIAVADDAATRAALRAALAAEVVVATSPAAVRSAARLQPLRARRGQRWCAVGTGTARALRRAGIAEVATPARMDSDGLLALPALDLPAGTTVGLLTAPGGRDRIAPALASRGAHLLRADVYARVPLSPAPRSLAALRARVARPGRLLSRGGALRQVLDQAPADVATRLRAARVVAASARLAALARAEGFGDIVQAAGPGPRDLVAAVQGG
ncbi:MAG: uroporphyrinogen-III synthase [Lysobacteraceae bacterium]